ncbi:hypothetical protein LX81_03193 [Palleronia aestuarii]|uniref:TrgA family protein n=1 Tax=Palleronia aestuarii TaxID=568105 RepID=A0A2W7N1S0_9RHOB|nr:TrgA family protein [Palleronia aestuarii]PZX13643.1 hypothetical protein LX81_03193 [Palleronia aestuarii]
MYPTAGKLVAAVLFAALAWIVCDLARDEFPQRVTFGWVSEAGALLGLVLGWRILGRQAGRGAAATAGAALTTAILFAVFGLALWAFVDTLMRISPSRLDGPFEALEEAVYLAIERARRLIATDAAAVLFAGSLVAGAITEFVARRYP